MGKWFFLFADVAEHLFMIFFFLELIIPLCMYLCGYDYTYIVFWRMFQVYKIRYKNRKYVRKDLLLNQMKEICDMPDVRVDKCDTKLRVLIILHWPLYFKKNESANRCKQILEENFKDIIELFESNTKFSSELLKEIEDKDYSKKHGDLEFKPDSGDDVFRHLLQADIIRTRFINSNFEGGKYNNLSDEEIKDVFLALLHKRVEYASSLRGGYKLAGGIFFKSYLCGYISLQPSEQMLKTEFGEELKGSFEAVRKGLNESNAKTCTVIDCAEYVFPSKEKIKL